MKLLAQLIDTIATLLVALVPGAIGATLPLAWERGLSWGQRFLQIAVGTVVSFYVSRAIDAGAHIYTGAHLDPLLMEGLKFTIGLIAFAATPRFIASCVDVVASLPARARDRWFPGKDN